MPRKRNVSCDKAKNNRGSQKFIHDSKHAEEVNTASSAAECPLSDLN